jgi:hypothetical protein
MGAQAESCPHQWPVVSWPIWGEASKCQKGLCRLVSQGQGDGPHALSRSNLTVSPCTSNVVEREGFG